MVINVAVTDMKARCATAAALTGLSLVDYENQKLVIPAQAGIQCY
jgi:hypothetical protein